MRQRYRAAGQTPRFDAHGKHACCCCSASRSAARPAEIPSDGPGTCTTHRVGGAPCLDDFLATLLAAFFDYYAAPLSGSGLTADLDCPHVVLSFHSDAKAAVTNHHAHARRRALLDYRAAFGRGFLHDL